MLILKCSKKSIAVENYCKNAFQLKSVEKVLKMSRNAYWKNTGKWLWKMTDKKF